MLVMCERKKWGVQVSIAFRHFEECLTLAHLDMAWLDEPCNAVLRGTHMLDRRMVIETLPTPPAASESGFEAPAAAPPKLRTWQYLCTVVSPDNTPPSQVCAATTSRHHLQQYSCTARQLGIAWRRVESCF
jgi:hypothetical protein